MNIFDKYIEQTEVLLAGRAAVGLPSGVVQPWPLAATNPFLMERDTAAELGGYPKESINLILSTSQAFRGGEGALEGNDGVFIIGDPKALETGEKHLSFGKIVLLTVKNVEEEKIYEYTQQVKLWDSRLRFRDVMVRTSPEQFLTNLRISRAAAAGGFSLERMALAIHNHFMEMPQVEAAKVILIAGESPLYRQLMPIAENVKRITTALNTMFDGIDMDCGSCSMSPICDEVSDLRRLHQETSRNKNDKG